MFRNRAQRDISTLFGHVDLNSDHEEYHDDDDVMVIGIDFGTTFSGAAWATRADFESEQVNLITAWPNNGREEGKAPTELFYENGQTMWGYEVPLDSDPVRWFKLLLLKDEDMEKETRSSDFVILGRNMLRETGRSSVELISEYLRLLWAHTIQSISKSRGEELVEVLRFHVVITVPAIWKGYARQGMQEAVKKAGILAHRPAGETKLTFVPEPEAAALATLSEPGRQISPGDVYVICDAGGGTVDLISYKVTDVDPIAMDEAVEGTGGLCGGIFIDEAFKYMCKRRLGRRWDHLSKAGINEILRGEWEQGIKRQYKPQASNKEYIVSIPAEAFGKGRIDDDSEEPHIKKGRIHFKGPHIQSTFKESFAGIEKLIDGQIASARQKSLRVKGIILVGGLGSSPYLYEHLKARYDGARITILQSGGMMPRTAICRGAIYKGFLTESSIDSANRDGPSVGLDIKSPISVGSTISRLSMGVSYMTAFDDDVHLEEDKTWDTDELVYKADKQMAWFIRRGENVSTTEPVKHGYYRLYKKDWNGHFSVFIYQCASSLPPPRRDKSVTQLCEIKCKLDVPYSSLDNFTSPKGKKMKKMSYDVVMVPSGASIEFTVSIDGRKLGAQHVAIEYQ
ncbi:hypothetical protein BDV30DRAFT_116736 [Aspergillus minisclerotigenes]|uniref:Actin-like ATPase domain-containing protein n=1 Tax=Aspergillus minisclerotigenes TaxID=656917 RepID=A0A5N6J3X9_9EURO|nr:hypothetical protein BDV30DRAFT_116736 [Aspergillus minisclerotigenes]